MLLLLLAAWQARALRESERLTEAERLTERLRGSAPLYEVSVNLDIEAMQTTSGVTMMFEKMQHNMRLDMGLGSSDGLAWGSYRDTIDSNG
jgi:hypothetical protein